MNLYRNLDSHNSYVIKIGQFLITAEFRGVPLLAIVKYKKVAVQHLSLLLSHTDVGLIQFH